MGSTNLGHQTTHKNSAKFGNFRNSGYRHIFEETAAAAENHLKFDILKTFFKIICLHQYTSWIS